MRKNAKFLNFLELKKIELKPNHFWFVNNKNDQNNFTALWCQPTFFENFQIFSIFFGAKCLKKSTKNKSRSYMIICFNYNKIKSAITSLIHTISEKLVNFIKGAFAA